MLQARRSRVPLLPSLVQSQRLLPVDFLSACSPWVRCLREQRLEQPLLVLPPLAARLRPARSPPRWLPGATSLDPIS
jgi:hypothetical protein